jgi:hypothetical protein
MNWDAVGAVGETIGSIAVLITIVYLALQVRQNNRNTKSLLQQGQSNRVVSALFEWGKTEFATVWLEGNGQEAAPEAVKELQFSMLCDMLIYDAMDYHHTYTDGLQSDEQFGSVCVGFAKLLQQPGFKKFWISWRGTRLQECPEFIEWMDGLVSRKIAPTDSNFV